MTKQNNITKKSSDGDSNNRPPSPRVYEPFSTNAVEYDKQIDILNPKINRDGRLEYRLFNNHYSSGKEVALAQKIKNINNFPELEKLSRKLNKIFRKKGAKYLLKKQKELNDNTIQISIALLNGATYLTYTKPNNAEETAKK